MHFHPLAHVPGARKILELVAAELRQRGEAHATVQLVGQTDIHAFDVMTGIRFHDHGTGVKGLRCSACPTGHGLRYEFRITTVDGVDVGPIGSTCIFTRALGRERGRRLGKTLEGGLESYQKRQAAEEQQALLAQVENWRTYMRTLGFEWVLLALARRGGLPPEMLAELTKAQERKQPLTAEQIKELKQFAPPAAPASPTFSPSPPSQPAPTAFSPTTAPSDALARPRKVVRVAQHVDQHLSPAAWGQYVSRQRLTAAVSDWHAVAKELPFDEATKTEIRDALRHCRPLRHEHLEVVVTACRAAGACPEPLPSIVQERERQKRAEEERARAEAEARARHDTYAHQRELHARVIEQRRQFTLQQSGLDVVDILDDPLIRKARRQWPNIRHLVPKDRLLMIEEGFRDHCLREDDYSEVERAIRLTDNPQTDPELRTEEGFLCLVESMFRFAHETRQAWQVRELRPSRLLLDAFKTDLGDYLNGKYIREEGLRGRVRRFLRDPHAYGQPHVPPAPLPPKFEPRHRPVASVLRDVPEAERGEALSLWGRGLAQRLPAEHRREIRASLQRGLGIPSALLTLLREAVAAHRQAAPPKKVEVASPPEALATLHAIPEQVLAEALKFWGLGLAERIPPEPRKVIGKALRKRQGLPLDTLHLLRVALVERRQGGKAQAASPQAQTAEAKARPSRQQGTAPAPVTTGSGRTATAFTVALCSALNAGGREEVRRQLVRRSAHWAAATFPREFEIFQRSGAIEDALLSALTVRLQ